VTGSDSPVNGRDGDTAAGTPGAPGAPGAPLLEVRDLSVSFRHGR
jgi:hypothetical protein